MQAWSRRCSLPARTPTPCLRRARARESWRPSDNKKAEAARSLPGSVSETLLQATINKKAKVIAQALDKANEQYLEQNKAPSRKVGEPDNRVSHFYVAMYWAQALAAQDDDAELKDKFSTIAALLTENEEIIVKEMVAVQGSPTDIGGYYNPDFGKASAAMRPSG